MEWNLVKGNTYTVDVTAGTLLFYKTGSTTASWWIPAMPGRTGNR